MEMHLLVAQGSRGAAAGQVRASGTEKGCGAAGFGLQRSDPRAYITRCCWQREQQPISSSETPGQEKAPGIGGFSCAYTSSRGGKQRGDSRAGEKAGGTWPCRGEERSSRGVVLV